MDRPDFADALRAAQAGEQQGYATLWERFSPRVAGFLRARGATDVDDLTSQVFFDAFRSLGSFTGDEKAFAAYLFTITRRRIVDANRRRSRRPDEVLGWEADLDPRIDPSAEDTALLNENHRWAAAALATLSEEQREVLLLRVFGDMTVEAIATELNKSTGAVKALQRRGLHALRRTLTDHPQARATQGEEAP